MRGSLNQRRNAELTKQQILDAASEIVIEQGFSALTATEIASRIGKDRTIVNHHFGNLANLKRVYIRGKDYWLPFFERFRLSAAPKAFEVQHLFTELMQENFRYFRNNVEMQKIILWQISENTPLMRRISEERETEGAKLLHTADAFFKDSGISFKAVEALLLGGIYYVVMHAENNKSTVCGIDANLERDRALLLDTIGQIIGWAWEKAIENKETTDMQTINGEFELLEAIVADLEKKAGSSNALSSESKRIERLVSARLLELKNPTQVSTMLNMVLQRLIRICDRLFDIHGRISAETRVLLELLSAVKNIVPQSISPALPLPKGFIQHQSEKLGSRWAALQTVLAGQGIGSLLTEITGLPVAAFALHKNRLVWADYTWLRRLFDFIENMDWTNLDCGSPEEALISALIRLGYNHQRFLGYCYRLIKEKTDAKVGRKAKLEELTRCKTLILQDVAVSDLRYESRTEKVGDQLCSWVDAEMKLIAQVEPDDTGDTFKNPFKFRHKMSVLATALWYKLQYDHGLFDEESLDVLAEKIARNCATKQQSDVSPGSVKTKFYTKDTATIKTVEELLVRMLDDLRNFF